MTPAFDPDYALGVTRRYPHLGLWSFPAFTYWMLTLLTRDKQQLIVWKRKDRPDIRMANDKAPGGALNTRCPA